MIVKSTLSASILALLISGITSLGATSYPVEGGRSIHGPIVHKNLGLFIVTGKDIHAEAADYVTLAEAMEKKWVLVHETGNVNQLAVENVTEGRTVIVLAGAVVKGGKQDRVLGIDLVLPPGGGKIPVASFCVEQSRWRARGGEEVDSFATNSAQVSGKGLRKAVKGGRGQGQVWKEVAAEQKKLSSNLKVNVQGNASPSSYQLAVENKELQKEIAAYKKTFADIMAQHPDATGYAVTINGEFSTADVYASRGLFRKMWQQHLEGAITEAVSVLDQAEEEQPIDLAWRDELFKKPSFEEKINKDTAGANNYIAGQNDKYFRYESRLKGEEEVSLRMSYEKREKGEALEQSESPDQNQLQLNQQINLPQQRGRVRR